MGPFHLAPGFVHTTGSTTARGRTNAVSVCWDEGNLLLRLGRSYGRVLVAAVTSSGVAQVEGSHGKALLLLPGKASETLQTSC